MHAQPATMRDVEYYVAEKPKETDITAFITHDSLVYIVVIIYYSIFVISVEMRDVRR